MKRKIAVFTLAVIAIAALVLTHIPKRITDTVTVADSNGGTAELTVDIFCFPNLIFPSYVKGTMSVDGIEYVDQYTIYKGFRGVKDNRLFPFDWWKQKDALPCNMTFIRSDCTDVISAMQNRINVLDVVLNNGIDQIHYMYLDESNQTGTNIEGISFWGPAENAEEAKRIAESFGYNGTGR